MIQYQKIVDPLPVLQKTIFANTVQYPDFESLDFFPWYRCQPAKKQEVLKALESTPRVLLTLAQQIFLSGNKGHRDKKKTYTLPLFFTPAEFMRLQCVLCALFPDLSAYSVTHAVHGTLWMVNTGSVTDFGVQILNQLYAENRLPSELISLYINKTVISDTQELGMYKITSKENSITEPPSAFFQKVCENDTIRSLDISALSMEACPNTSFLHYLLQRKKHLYFYTENHRFANKRVSKHLIWEGNDIASFPD